MTLPAAGAVIGHSAWARTHPGNGSGVTTRRRMTALAFTALVALTGAACGDDDGTVGEPSSTSLVPNGEQQGSGSDGSVPGDDPPGNTPGGSNTADEPSG